MFIRIAFLSVAISIMLACGTDQKKYPATASLTEAEVKNFISAYDSIWNNRDTSSLKETMTDNYIYFTSTGSTTDRSRIISWFTPADKYKVDTASRTEINIYLNGNTAIVSSRWTGSGSFGDERFNDDQRCSIVVQKIKGKLQVMGEHCTQITRKVLV